MAKIKKKSLKKILRGIAVAIIVYIAFSMLSTKIIYDVVFKRHETESTSFTTDLKSQSFSYPSGDNDLSGTLYSDGSTECGLIVLTPGFNSSTSDYIGVIDAFVKKGFDIFAFDPTGHGNSDGESSVGFPQVIKDLEATLKFVEGNFKYKDVFLLGHSWGGYATCCNVNNHSGITAAASVNGMDTSMDAIMAQSVRYVGYLAYGNYPFLSAYQSIIFGTELSGASSVEEINKSKVPVLIIQAKNDDVLNEGKYSIYSNRKKVVSEKVDFCLYDKYGSDGHTSILYDKNKKPNYDIVNKIAQFYIQKSKDKEITK